MVEQRRVEELEAAGARDRDLLSYFEPEDILFLDLETTGLVKNYYREEERHRQNKIP